jgi:ubiquinone/menaquinone biosynthesis C-methylase UbiE
VQLERLLRLSDLTELQLLIDENDYRLNNLLRYMPVQGKRFLDVGAGNGVVCLRMKNKFEEVHAADHDPVLVKSLIEKGIDAKKLDASKIHTLDRSYDVIALMDILEHLEDDQACLESCYSTIIPGGKIFITAPAFPCLFGYRDKKYYHYRRYKMNELIDKVENAGFYIKKKCYFNFTGLVPYIISDKIFKKPLEGPSRGKKGFINSVLNFFLKLERHLPLPGLTIIIIGEVVNE